MDDSLIECVPNFSEGVNMATIDAIADAIRTTPGVSLLDVDPGASTNRTVFTFVGNKTTVVDGAFNAAAVAKKLIDMSTHTGAHPRFGAMDVCPFIPVRNATMEDCVKCSKEMGRRMGTELNLPVFLYENSSTNPSRKKLPQIRQEGLGEYEGIAENITKPEWKPDYGPQSFVPSWGCTAVGARMFLIAYNINLLGTKEQANRIAFNVREKGRGPDKPGRFKNVAGIGWYVDEYNLAQISVNCTNYKLVNLHTVFESCKSDAQSMNLAVAGSELVGLVPLDCMIDAAKYYMEKENLFLVDEKQMVALAIDRLGLNSVSRFDPNERIIDWKCAATDPPLMSMTVKEFINILGARTSAPGGGSASALAAAMGTGLGAMMGWMSYGSLKFVDLDPIMRKNIKPLHDATQKLIYRIDADTDAFSEFQVAMRLPRGSEEEKAVRVEAMQLGLKTAIDVPLETMRIANMVWGAMIEMAKVGNINSKSDLQVGARCLEVGIWGCFKNVEINMLDIKDEDYKRVTMKEACGIAKEAKEQCDVVLDILDKR